MSLAIQQPFVHVVATVNLDDKTGDILYVNPSRVASQGTVPSAPTDYNVAIIVKNAAGKELLRVQPEVRLDSCHDEETPRVGLIQHDVAAVADMSRLDLTISGKVVATFTAGTAEEDESPVAMGLGPPQSDSPQRRAMAPTTELVERPGISYTMQARANDELRWTTLAVGRKLPEFDIDKNQFPGARKLQVRVVRNSGFTSEIIDEHDVSIDQ